MNARKAYPSDVTDSEWKRLEPFLVRGVMGRPLKHSPRELINAIFYMLKNGCTWRALPHDLPPWQTVYTYFRKLERDGVWQRMNAVLREDVRVQAGRNPQPSAAIIDSQSVKTTQKGGLAATMQAKRSTDANAISS
jgi:putative transposase